MKHSFFAPLLLSFFACTAACSSVEPSSSPPVANDMESFVREVCAQYMPCCAKNGRSTDGAACRAVMSAAMPGAYNATEGNKCLAELSAVSKSETFCEADFSPDSCRRATTSSGTAKPGEACTDNRDCASSSEGAVECVSQFRDGASIRKCQVQLAGKIGDGPCGGTVEGNSTTSFSSGSGDLPSKAYLCNYRDGARCDSESGKCVAVSKTGESCKGFNRYSCTPDAYCSSGTCKPRGAIGAACEAFASECVKDAFCDKTTKRCSAVLPHGAACANGDACKSHSCVNGKCESNDLASALLCGG